MPVSRETKADLRRRLPAVEEVRQEPAVRALEERFGRALVLRHLRDLLDEARVRAAKGDGAGLAAALANLNDDLAVRLAATTAGSLVPVINATGVVIHTNLGRAPLSAAVAAAVARIAASYSNLEYDLASGKRGRRESHVTPRLRRLLGVEGTVVVNNNAAAVLLAVNTLAEGKDVIVSRGELVEIGGSFRIPDVIRKGGARLREVGTTNRTRLSDYRAALSPEAGMILKVHPSNFKIVGFTEAPGVEELLSLAREAGVPLMEDLGSGLLTSPSAALGGEPTAAASLAAGLDLVSFSGDKLLGGPQAGILAGRKAIVEALRRNPLYRALRVDKMTLAALDLVLADHETGHPERVPVLRLLSLSAAALRQRAEALARGLGEDDPRLRVEVVDGTSAVGGGAAPTVEIPTALLAIVHPSRSPDRLASALREGTPPVVARIADGRLVLDLRTVLPEEEPMLRQAMARAAAD